MREKLKKVLTAIHPVDRSIQSNIMDHLNDLTKPPGSLGKLEEIALKYCLMTQTATPKLGIKKIFTFAGDHGVSEEGVSAFPKEVTQQMVSNMINEGAAINVLARHVNSELVLVDVGVDGDLENVEGILHKKVKSGTDNMAKGMAMSIEEAEQALEVGIELVESAVKAGTTMVGTGEMGIANTTPSAALFSALLPAAAEEMTGRGTGIDDQALQNKIRVIKQALEINKEQLATPLGTLAAVGGLEIAAICGVVLGAAYCKIPVVIDGFISSAAALVACKMNEAVKDYLFFSHLSAEAGHKEFFGLYQAEPILDFGMRLGEGTGAALAMSIIEASVKIYNEMATFSSAGVSQ